MSPNEYDEGEHVKEVFAYFGRAYYMSSVFETGLQLAVLHLDFLTEVSRRLQTTGLKNFDRPQYEAEFNAFMAQQEALTLGKLIKRFRALAFPPDSFQLRIDVVKGKRDLLAHHYFRERSVEFAQRRGRDKMIEELDEATNLFKSVDRELTQFMEPVRARLGIRKDVLEAYEKEFFESIKDDYDE